ncbi:Sugar Specific PTS Enzyme II [Salmonella enterica subsp. enterica]|uniref:Sugar Specific PTS Enzyme II n=1 Tax=Salmonella enterica I TaxID=59201 RepID=A0A3S4ITT9_SALET|nr:Sugar Specific PTS Enzyme II [Salmonella enterica subsp. enterica]
MRIAIPSGCCFAPAATDAEAHIRTIQRISQWLDSPESVAMLQDAPNDAALFAQLTALR